MKDVILESFLSTVLIFLSLNMILTFFFEFGFKLEISILLSIFFLIFNLVKRARSFYVRIYEEKIPELREALRTAYEYRGQRNYVVNELFSEIWKKLKNISSGEIISPRSVFLKIILIAILSLFTIVSGFFTPEFPKIELFTQKNFATFQNNEIELIEDPSIFGEKKIFENSSEEIELQIEAFKNMVGEKEKLSDGRISAYRFPFFEPKQEEAFEEKVFEDFELIKRYNELLRDAE